MSRYGSIEEFASDANVDPVLTDAISGGECKYINF